MDVDDEKTAGKDAPADQSNFAFTNFRISVTRRVLVAGVLLSLQALSQGPGVVHED